MGRETPERVAICLERLRTLARGSLEGFCMYTHYLMGVSAPSLH